MQNLWSRISRIRSSCQCSSCLHSTIAAGRRTTTAGIRRRDLAAGEFLTACYSSILATAALADARVKEKRLKDWDQAIADVKAGKPVGNIPEPSMKDQVDKDVTNWDQVIEGLKRDSTSERTAESVNKDERATELETDLARSGSVMNLDVRANGFINSSNGTSDFEPLKSNDTNEGSPATWSHLDNAWNENNMALATMPKTQTEPTISKSTQWAVDSFELQPMSVERAILMSENSASGREELQEWTEPLVAVRRSPRGGIHLQKMAITIRRLVDQLIHEYKLAHLIQDNGEDKWVPSRDPWPGETGEIVQMLVKLKNQFVQPPIYLWNTDEEVFSERDALNSSMRQMFARVNLGEQYSISTIVGKVCYNLLITDAPPNVEMYNILIKELTRLQEYKFCQIVVDSLLYNNKMILNDNCVKLILDYYIATRDSRGFREIVKRMRGVHREGKDMRVKRKFVWQLATYEWAQRWAFSPEVKLAHRNGYLIEKYHRTAPIFESLIRGSLILLGPGSAARTVRAAIREGQPVSSETMHMLIKVCVATSDYKTGVKILDGMLTYWDDGRTKSVLSFDRSLRSDIYKLLSLCGIDPGGDLWPSLHPYLSWDSLRSMMEYIKSQASEESLRSATRSLVIQTSLSNEQVSPMKQAENPSDLDLENLGHDSASVKESGIMSTSNINELGCETFEPGSVEEYSHLLEKLLLMKGGDNERTTRTRKLQMLIQMHRNIQINGIEARIEVRAIWIRAAGQLIESNIEIINYYNRHAMRTYIGQSCKTISFRPKPAVSRSNERTTLPRNNFHASETSIGQSSEPGNFEPESVFKSLRIIPPGFRDDDGVINMPRLKTLERRRVLKQSLSEATKRLGLPYFRFNKASLTEPPTPRVIDMRRLEEKNYKLLGVDFETRGRLGGQLGRVFEADGRKDLVDKMVSERVGLAIMSLMGNVEPVKRKGLLEVRNEKHPRLQIRYHPFYSKDEVQQVRKLEGEAEKETETEVKSLLRYVPLYFI